MIRTFAALLPVAALLVIGLRLSRTFSRAAEARREMAREAARHREVLDRSARWIREGRMRAVLSSPGAKSWYLAVAAHHLQLATEADASAGLSDSPEFPFLAEQHRLMHHIFMTAPLQATTHPGPTARANLRA
jgi:hypothetical protein